MSRQILLRLIAILGLACACSITPGCSKSGEDPDKIVLGLYSNVPGPPMIVFRYPELLIPGDTVSAFADDEENGWTSVIFTAQEDTHFYFADYLDGYFYGHQVEYIFVTSAGEVTRIEGQWWPEVNGQEVFFTTQQRESVDDILVEFPAEWIIVKDVEKPLGSINSKQITNVGISPITLQTRPMTAGSGIGIVVNGVSATDSARSNAENAVKQAEDALRASGHYGTLEKFDAGTEDKKCATRDAFIDRLKNLEAPPGTNLTLVFVAHGSNGGSIKMGRCGMHRSKLQPLLKNLNDRGIRVKIIIEACYSGIFVSRIGYLTQNVKVAITSSDDESSSAEDIDQGLDRDGNRVEDSNPEDKGPEFMSGYWEDYQEINDRLNPAGKHGEEKEKAEALRDWFAKLVKDANDSGADVTLEELILYAAYQSALEKDLSARIGYIPAGKTRRVFPEPQRFPKDHSAPGLQEDGNDNDVPDWIEILNGYMSAPLRPTPTPNPTPTPTPTSTPTKQVRKLWYVYAQSYSTGYEHYEGFSDIGYAVYILGNDPVPMPNATVTMRMTRPDGGSETQLTVTDNNGVATGRFRIYMYGNYTLQVENIQGENMVYDPTQNGVDYTVVEVGPGESPIPGADTVMIGAFFNTLNTAFELLDVTPLLESLHSSVIDRYSTPVCLAYIEARIDTPVHRKVIQVTGQGAWVYETDGLSTTIENAYSVVVDTTAQGQTSRVVVHLAREGEHLRWFTDCGDPLP